MKILTFLLVIALVAIAAFLVLNWSAITAPTALSIGVTAIQAPLGFVMLGFLVLFTALLLVFMIYSKTSEFFKKRHHVREMQAIQGLADNAETSRFTEMRDLLEAELKRQADLHSESTATVLSRLDQLDGALLFATNGLDRRIM